MSRIYVRSDLMDLSLRRPAVKSEEILRQFPSYLELLAMGRTFEAKSLRAKYRDASRRITNKAVLAGLIQRKTECDVCATTGPLAKHHPDYQQPLLIQWLCHECHVRADIERRAWERPFVNGTLSSPTAMRHLANGKIQRAEADLVAGHELLARADAIEAELLISTGRAA